MKPIVLVSIMSFLWLSACKKTEEPIGPSNNPYQALFAEKFDDESDWQYHLMEFDSIGNIAGYINPNFFFSNGMAELSANQNNNCDRKALTKTLNRSQQIIDIINSDTLFVSLKINEIDYAALGWSSIIIALDKHFLRFAFNEINVPTTYTLKISDWQLFDPDIQGDPDAEINMTYSNNPDEFGTDKLIIKADACEADLGAEARIVVDEISLVTRVTAL